jgi:hypothetical protein
MLWYVEIFWELSGSKPAAAVVWGQGYKHIIDFTGKPRFRRNLSWDPSIHHLMFYHKWLLWTIKHGWFMSTLLTVFAFNVESLWWFKWFKLETIAIQPSLSNVWKVSAALQFVDLNQTVAFCARLLCCLAFTWLIRRDRPESSDLRVDIGKEHEEDQW